MSPIMKRMVDTRPSTDMEFNAGWVQSEGGTRTMIRPSMRISMLSYSQTTTRCLCGK